MEFKREHDPFQSVAQWHIWRVGLDLADNPDVLIPGYDNPAGLAWHNFYIYFLSNLYTHPKTYGLPQEPYEAYVPGDKEQEDRLRGSRLKAKKAIEVGYLEFLYQLGQAGEVDGPKLIVARPFFDQLVAEKIKKTKIKLFPQGSAQLGLVFEARDTVVVTQPQYSGVLAGLSVFAKACITIPEYGFYFFRRCDYNILSGKMQPSFDDALRLAPESMQMEISETDQLLLGFKFNREIFVADAGAGYRLRYSKKSAKLVYWCRVMNNNDADLYHNLRWDFNSDVTPMLFQILGAGRPDLVDRIYAGIKKCAHCYEPCMARAIIMRNGQEIECCLETGWEINVHKPEDFADLRTVVKSLVNLPDQ